MRMCCAPAFPVREAPILMPLTRELACSLFLTYAGGSRSEKLRNKLITDGQLVNADTSCHAQDRWAIFADSWTTTHRSPALGEPRAEPAPSSTPALSTGLSSLQHNPESIVHFRHDFVARRKLDLFVRDPG